MLFSNDPAIWLKDFLIESGLSYSFSALLSTIGLVLIVTILSWLSNMLAKAIILNIVTRIVKRTTSQWDDIFLEQKVFTRLSHLAPALVIWFMAGWALKNKTDAVTYENVQSEIFEHILSVMNAFELKVFQQPSGEDILALSKNGIEKIN